MTAAEVQHALQLPPEEVGRALLCLPEDQWFDRKSRDIAPRNLADAEISFANAEGGTIVVGLWNREVRGVDPAHVNPLKQAAIDFSHPPVRTLDRLVECLDDGDGGPGHLLVIEVEPGETVHANVKDRVFLRVGDEDRRLTFAQRRELLYDKGQALYESTSVPATSVDDVRMELLREYAAALAHPDPSRLLTARGLATKTGELTVAGLLLFGEQPQLQLPNAYVRVLRYRGIRRGTGSRQELLDDVRCEGAIPEVLGRARSAIATLQPTRRALGQDGRFEPVALVPEDAWLEGLVNAVVHRSYSLAGDHVRVEIFDDRIEVESPGRFPGLFATDDPLEATRFARNPRVARVCADLNFGQELGEGIRRMFEEMRLARLADPLYRQTQASVQLSLSGVPIDRELESRLPPETRRVIAVLRDADRLGTGEVAEALSVSRPVAIRILQSLRAAGLVEWVGNSAKDPRAYWRLPGGG